LENQKIVKEVLELPIVVAWSKAGWPNLRVGFFLLYKPGINRGA